MPPGSSSSIVPQGFFEDRLFADSQSPAEGRSFWLSTMRESSRASISGRRAGCSFAASFAGHQGRASDGKNRDSSHTRGRFPDVGGALFRPGRKMQVGSGSFLAKGSLSRSSVARRFGLRMLRFSPPMSRAMFSQHLGRLGHVPLPRTSSAPMNSTDPNPLTKPFSQSVPARLPLYRRPSLLD